MQKKQKKKTLHFDITSQQQFKLLQAQTQKNAHIMLKKCTM